METMTLFCSATCCVHCSWCMRTLTACSMHSVQSNHYSSLMLCSMCIVPAAVHRALWLQGELLQQMAINRARLGVVLQVRCMQGHWQTCSRCTCHTTVCALLQS
jgi:hypothetical protein